MLLLELLPLLRLWQDLLLLLLKLLLLLEKLRLLLLELLEQQLLLLKFLLRGLDFRQLQRIATSGSKMTILHLRLLLLRLFQSPRKLLLLIIHSLNVA